MNSGYYCCLFLCISDSSPLVDQKKTGEVAAEAEKKTDTEIETEIGKRTERDGIVPDPIPDPGHAPETVIGIEIETVAREETNLPAGLSAHLVREKTKRESLTAGGTNMWIALHLRSLLLVISTMERLPASCSLVALFNLRDSG